jgi:energy-converting hydrogenase Eha subunit B
MIGNAIAAWIGNSIDRRDGEGGTLGALAGVATWNIAKKVVPAAIVLGGVAYAVHRFKRANASAPV